MWEATMSTATPRPHHQVPERDARLSMCSRNLRCLNTVLDTHTHQLQLYPPVDIDESPCDLTVPTTLQMMKLQILIL
jgi:hypothetical protein